MIVVIPYLLVFSFLPYQANTPFINNICDPGRHALRLASNARYEE